MKNGLNARFSEFMMVMEVVVVQISWETAFINLLLKNLPFHGILKKQLEMDFQKLKRGSRS